MKKTLAILAIFFVLFIPAGCQTNGGNTAGTAAKTIGSTGDAVSMDSLKQQDNGKKAGYQLDAPEKGEEIAVITMESGEVIKMRFFPDEAPLAVYNFKMHAQNGYYDGLTFHRIIANFMIQGGDPTGTGSGGESVWGEAFKDEFNKNLLNLDGSVAMANSGESTNGSQFFINITGNPEINWDYYDQVLQAYNDDPEAFVAAYPTMPVVDFPEDIRAIYNEHGGNFHLDGAYRVAGGGHTVFAQVFEGMDAVKALSETPANESGTPNEEVKMQKVEIVVYE